MPQTLRPFAAADLDAVVELSLRAWLPIFTSWRSILGDRLFSLAYPDWRRSQGDEVRSTCTKHSATTIVAELEGRVVGFATVVIGEPDSAGTRVGDLEMIAVDPLHQRQGAGRDLMQAAVDMMRKAGCDYASVWTGGDEGHSSARALYEANGFTPLPVVHYYREL